MEKPTSVARKEFMENMVTLINKSELPFFVIEPILKDLHSKISAEAERIYLLEKKEYEEALKAEREGK